jgi:hypothetical protein
MVPDSTSWPNLVLPLKRWDENGQNLELGYLLNCSAPYYVRDGNIFCPDLKIDKIIATFDTVEDLIAAGWVVD